MFDLAFSEIVVIGVVALVVIGPERLPKVARTAGHLLGRLQRYVSDVKADISKEMEAAELGELKNLKKEVEILQSEVNQTADEISRAATENINFAQKQIDEVRQEVGSLADGSSLDQNETASASASQATESVDLAPTPSIPATPTAEPARAEAEVARPQLELGLAGGELHNSKAA